MNFSFTNDQNNAKQGNLVLSNILQDDEIFSAKNQETTRPVVKEVDILNKLGIVKI
jgi:hypothetical protein